MTISYEKLWQLLAERKMKIKDLQAKTSISSTIMANMRKSCHVSTRTLKKICEVLDCNIGDIVEFVK